MLEVVEGIVVFLVILILGIFIGIATAAGQYFRHAAKVMKKTEEFMDPLAKFYSKMYEDNDLF